jgi:hypothetical protein
MNRAISTTGMILIALGAVGILAAVFAWSRAVDRTPTFTPSHDLSEAVADPNVNHTPGRRAHVR